MARFWANFDGRGNVSLEAGDWGGVHTPVGWGKESDLRLGFRGLLVY